ncbi:MAG: hypothetical protein D6762_02025 [Candidatus Neomarinimicrobiota bacterium]|nr:MAG: hypothetical protein D6762_02025 [Candidatus Neomarinimicrobiota bacterium]
MRPVPTYTSIQDLFLDAIRDEQEAAAWYREAARQTSLPDIKTLLNRLAEMEDRHALELSRCLDALNNQYAVRDGILSSFGETGLNLDSGTITGKPHD